MSDEFYEDDEPVTDVITAFERGLAKIRERDRQVDTLRDVWHEPTHVLLTGAAGFVGSHLLSRILRDTDWIVHCPVSFRHHGNPVRITDVVAEVAGESGVPASDVWDRVKIDICDLASPLGTTIQAHWSRCRYVFNVASSSHVDRSITEPGEFIRNNVALMTNVLDAARRMPGLELFLQMSTDEVYGPAYGSHQHREWETILPSNPYSASKAAQEAIAFSYWRTYDLPIIITNTMNIIGERQDAEKFLPLVIRHLTNGEKITVHSGVDGVAGSRFYLHADNLVDAWLAVVRHYTAGPWGPEFRPVPHYSYGWNRPARFNVVGEREIKNDDLVKLIAGMLPGFLGGADPAAYAESLIERVDFHSARPGHDLRYALDGQRIHDELDWTPPVPLEESIRKTVEWYITNPEWLQP